MEQINLLTEWWIWAVGVVALLVLEVLAPGFLFLGFAVGAGMVALLLALGLLGANIPVMAVLFAALSLIAWIVMRRMFGLRKTQVKIWDKDINDDV